VVFTRYRPIGGDEALDISRAMDSAHFVCLIFVLRAQDSAADFHTVKDFAARADPLPHLTATPGLCTRDTAPAEIAAQCGINTQCKRN